VTSTSVEALAQAVGWTGAGGNVDPALVAAAWGTALPPDYLDYAERFPSGVYLDLVHVYAPTVERPGMDSDVAGIQRLLRNARQWYPATARAVHPEPGGVLPWGTSGTEWAFCWDTTDADPARWPVIVCELSFDPYLRYDGTMSEFLTALVTGTTGFDDLMYMFEVDPSYGPDRPRHVFQPLRSP
jgi:hypothetical protein